jgi:hypothetical protein
MKKSIALFLVIAMLQICVQADFLRTASSAALTETVNSGQQPLQGRLSTAGNNPVTVNGNSARTGETIFSGQQIQTPAGTGASIDLGSLGRIDMAPNTNLTPVFERGRVTLRLTSGCAILTANKGVAGSVESGTSTTNSDPATGAPVDICIAQTPGAPPVVGQGAASAAGAGAGTAPTAAAAGTAAGGTTGAAGASGGGLFGLGTKGTAILLASIGGAAIATAAVVVPCRRGRNPSPGTPRGGNDECQ